MTTENSSLSEEEVLLAFSVEPVHDSIVLEYYLSHYSEHAQALLDCSIELMIDASRGSFEVQLTSDHAVEQAWRQFEQAVHPVTSAADVNPFAQLSPSAFKSIAKRLNISNLLLIRLRERAISAATIPGRFIQCLAFELGATADIVSAYLHNPPSMVAGQSLRSSVKPVVTEQVSFEQAIKTSQLTTDQQDALKMMCD